jgi:hypothetical protein
MPETIRETTLRELLKTRSVSAASAVGLRGGFRVQVQCGSDAFVLGSTRGGVRMFSNLTTLAAYLLRLGISRFEVDASDYRAARVRAARPDRAVALKRTRTKPQQPDLLHDRP